jgi:surface antigen
MDRLAVSGDLRSARLYKDLHLKMHRKTVRRRAFRAGLIAVNVAVLGIILAFVINNPASRTAIKSSVSGEAGSAAANPLDQVSSADIALTVARMGSLPETTAINNQVQSQAAEIAMSSTSNNVVNKPQVVATALKSSADIKDYVVLAGDSVPSIAAKFGVTSESVRWSNNLNGDNVSAGTKLRIPPVNGIVYTVNSGDTPDSLASKYHASKDKIIAYNDAEIKGLTPGATILIPDAVQQAAAAPDPHTTALRGAYAWGTAPMYGVNGYDYGYCTWYVATRISVPGNWGNANTWAYYAGQGGWTVSKRPIPGAIAQTTGPGLGHVAVVEAVSDDGTMIKYSDMNGLAGWGRVGTTADWVTASRFNNYIYH